MKRLRCLALLTLWGSLSSCAFHHYALIPPPGNTAWAPEEQSAVVLVGLNVDEPVGSLFVAGDLDAISLASSLFPPNEQHAVAVHFRAGETFQLTGFSYLNMYNNMTKHMVFKELPALTLDEPGIYFYGNIIARNDEAALVEGFEGDIVALAMEKYPKVFTALRPVNFDPARSRAAAR